MAIVTEVGRRPFQQNTRANNMSTSPGTSMSDLQKLVDAVRLNGSISSENVDVVADTLRTKLNFDDGEDKELYHEMAKLFLNRCTVKKSRTGNERQNEECNDLTDQNGTQPQTTTRKNTNISNKEETRRNNRGRSPGRPRNDEQSTDNITFRSPLRFFGKRPKTPQRARDSPKKRSLSPFRIFRRNNSKTDLQEADITNRRQPAPPNKIPSKPLSESNCAIPSTAVDVDTSSNGKTTCNINSSDASGAPSETTEVSEDKQRSHPANIQEQKNSNGKDGGLNDQLRCNVTTPLVEENSQSRFTLETPSFSVFSPPVETVYSEFSMTSQKKNKSNIVDVKVTVCEQSTSEDTAKTESPRTDGGESKDETFSDDEEMFTPLQSDKSGDFNYPLDSPMEKTEEVRNPLESVNKSQDLLQTGAEPKLPNPITMKGIDDMQNGVKLPKFGAVHSPGGKTALNTPDFKENTADAQFCVDLKKSNKWKAKLPKRSVPRRNKTTPVNPVLKVEPLETPKMPTNLFCSPFIPHTTSAGGVNNEATSCDGSPMETDDESLGEVDNSSTAKSSNQPTNVQNESIFSLGVNTAGVAPRRKQVGARVRALRRNQNRTSASKSTSQVLPTGQFRESTKENAENCKDPSFQHTSPSSNVDLSGKIGLVRSVREEARSFYLARDYRSAARSYTKAVQILSSAGQIDNNIDLLAVLYSNRAAVWLMLGAFDAALIDSQRGLEILSKSTYTGSILSHDNGPVLQSKLYTRMARAYLKIGNADAAKKAFNGAIETSSSALNVCRQVHTTEELVRDNEILQQVSTDAELGKTEASRYAEGVTKIRRISMQSAQRTVSSERRSYVELLGHVNIALSNASGCVELHEKKGFLLAKLKRWREVAGHCERLAASKVRFDDLFRGALTDMCPFPGVPPAAALSADFFGGLGDEDYKSAELKLNSKAAAEAVLRLPPSMAPYYIRALRLEERYPAAELATQILRRYVESRCESNPEDQDQLQKTYSWLPHEQSKLNRTKIGRERGDELFRAGEFEQASAQYALCLIIDANGSSGLLDASDTSGGRLHAVLHCNRAACLMAMRRFQDAVKECTAALRIHSRYMKAMLRRARCYSRLERFEESVVEYKRWLELTEEAKKKRTVFITPCLFDGPRDVSTDDILLVKKELDEVLKLKQKKETTAKEEARYRNERQKFHNGAYADAQRRREHWHTQKGDGDSRRWDPFAGKSPRRNRNTNQSRPEFWGRQSQNNGKNNERQKGYGNERKNSYKDERHNSYKDLHSPGSDPTLDHYRVLQVPVNADASEVKKSYRKMALKYHPDKNKDPDAVDTFRRVKMAYEVLNDTDSRRKFDMERRYKR